VIFGFVVGFFCLVVFLCCLGFFVWETYSGGSENDKLG